MTEDLAIPVEKLSKRSVLNHQRAGGDGLRHGLQEKLSATFRRFARRDASADPAANPQATSEEFWALKDVSFEVKRGEVVGILDRLLELGAVVHAHDPIALAPARRHYAGQPVTFVEDWPAAVPTADAVVVATAWRDYTALRGLRPRVLADARRMFQPGDFPESVYLAIGLRPAQHSATP
jgi:UDP-glucose/GDP-mannose dehydrogenase family, UDP binding domain